MSDFCQKPRPSLEAVPAVSGFTLLEMLVVLTMVGLLTVAALPQFSVIRDRLTFALNRESFERELGGLSYQAFKEGRPLVLSGQHPRRPDDLRSSADTSLTTDDAPLLLEPGQLRPMRPATSTDATLSLPDDWRASIANPIVYQTSGYCGGGAVTLSIGALQYVYELKPPTCQAELQE